MEKCAEMLRQFVLPICSFCQRAVGSPFHTSDLAGGVDGVSGRFSCANSTQPSVKITRHPASRLFTQGRAQLTLRSTLVAASVDRTVTPEQVRPQQKVSRSNPRSPAWIRPTAARHLPRSVKWFLSCNELHIERGIYLAVVGSCPGQLRCRERGWFTEI